MESEPTLAEVPIVIQVDADDIVRALGNNDELILAFVLELLQHAGSSELNERLVERLTADTKTEG